MADGRVGGSGTWQGMNVMNELAKQGHLCISQCQRISDRNLGFFLFCAWRKRLCSWMNSSSTPRSYFRITRAVRATEVWFQRGCITLATLKMTISELRNICAIVSKHGPPESSCRLSQWKKISWAGKCEPCAWAPPSCLPQLRNGLPFEILGARSLHAEAWVLGNMGM